MLHEYVEKWINKGVVTSDLYYFANDNIDKISVEDIQRACDFIFRTRWMTRDRARAVAFIVIFNLMDVKSKGNKFLKFPEPKNGMMPTNIKHMGEFIESQKESIYTFVKEVYKELNG